MADTTLVAAIMAALHAKWPAVPDTDVNGGLAAIADTILSPVTVGAMENYFKLGNGYLVQFGWNYIKTSGAGTTVAQVKTFPTPFKTGVIPLVILCNYIGFMVATGSEPTSPTSFTSYGPGDTVHGRPIDNSTWRAILMSTDGIGSLRMGFYWVAIGEAP